MAQRLNKKLLLGLGSSLGFLGTGVISGFGINAIVNNGNNFNQDQLALNTLPEADFKTASDYNVATSDMFVDTTNLKRFHFGNTQRGQTVTPYGWLGVFEDSTTVQNRIALTGWNGEILWVNEDYKNQQTADFNVYEMKYDFNTNLIFVLRSSSQNGLVDDNTGSLGLANVQLDILDAATGQRIANGGQAINANEFAQLQSKALNAIRQKFLNINGLANKKPIANLFQLDVVSISNTKVLVTWMPNFMLLKSLSFQTFPSFMDVIDNFANLTKSFVFEKTNSSQVNKYTKNINLRGNPNSEFSPPAGSPNWFRFWDNNAVDSSLTNYVILTNPFFTVIDGNKLILHLIVAKNKNFGNSQTPEITHKIMGFAESNGAHLKFDYDKSEQIGGTQIGGSYSNLLTVDSKLSGNITAWSRAAFFGADFINANLRINRNMFDGNSVVFAYPYAAQSDKGNNNFPIFNVAQLQIDQSSGLLLKNNTATNKKRNTNWDFGKQFVDHYERNKGNYSNPTVNKVYPYPNITTNFANLHHNYHRLISVSPFDNTFVYAGKSNLTDQVLEQTNANASNYASFWISTNDKFSSGKSYARSLIIGNNASLNNATVSSYMTDFSNEITKGFEGLYNDGFTFDPRSLENVNGGKKSLQLYFNQTGTGKNDVYTSNNFRTSKIGLLDDVLQRASSNDNSGANLWVDNIANVSKITNKNLFVTGITLDSYSTLIHSRANLEKWYPRTFWNNTNPGNNLAANYALNESANSDTRATANTFNNQLNSAEFNNKVSVDLVSAWKDKNNNASKNPPNYNRLFVKRPQIKIRNQSIENQLPTETTYPLVNNNFLTGWLPANSIDRFIFKTQQNIANASYEILTTFGKTNNNIVLSNIGNATDNLDLRYEASANQPAAWFDKRKRPNDSGQFGTWNNNVPIDNKTPLRLMAKIIKPTNSPGWFNRIDPQIFANPYPIDNLAPGETGFQEVLNQFVREKTQNLEIAADSTNAAVGLANLKIEVYLGLNPNFIANSGNKIYTNGSNNKMIVDTTTGQRVIYNDRLTGSRTIYDQSELKYASFKFGGLIANKVNSNLWKNGFITTARQKVNVAADYSQLQDTLVRKSPGNTDPIFKFNYAPNGQDIELTPVDFNWFSARTQMLNKMVNLYIGFQYKTDSNNNWTDFIVNSNDSQITGGQRRFFYDEEIKFTNGKVIFRDFPVRNVTKMRLKLWKKEEVDAAKDPNHFVKYLNFNSTNDITSDNPNPLDKFISIAHTIATQKVIVDNTWFNQVFLTSNDILQNINEKVFQDYENTIFQKSSSITANQALRQQVKLVYQWQGQSNWIDAPAMANLIKSKLNFGAGQWTTTDQGVWSLSNGNNPGGFTIKAKFEKVDPSSNVQFTSTAGTALNDSQLSGNVKANIKTKVELGPWFDFLKSQKITAQKGNANGVLVADSLVFPNMSGAIGSAQFAGRPFAFIQKLLNDVGIRLRFKRWEANQGAWSGWLSSINDLTTYNPSDPKIAIGFLIENPNVAVKNNNTDFTSDSVIELNLNLPKLVKAPTNVQQMISQFNQQNPFGGNTFDLTIDAARLTSAQQQIINALKTASQSGNNAAGFTTLDNALDFKYQLGNSAFSDANALKTFLAGQTNIDQSDNTLKLQVSIKATYVNEYQLDTNFPNEFILQPRDNTVIKKWIHGTAYEAALAGPGAVTLSPNSSKNNLQYNYHRDLQTLFTAPGREGLVVQWSYGSSPDAWKNLKNGQNPLPTSVAATENSIRIRVAREQNNQIYLYGPEQNSRQTIFNLDLSQIPTPVQIDNAWFNKEVLSVDANQFLQDISGQHFTNYEDAFFANSQSLSGANNAALRAKVKLEFQFNKRGAWLNSTQIAADIIKRLNNFTASDQGIFALSHDGTIYNGNANLTKFVFVINARVVKAQPNDATIQFVSPNDPNQTISGSQLEGNLKSNIQTKIDLGPWLNEIQNAGIIAARGQKPGQLNSSTIRIPGKASANSQVQFGGKSFSQIQTILNNVNVFVQYKKYDANAQDFWSGWLNSSNLVDSYNVQNPQIVIGFKTPNNEGNANDRIPLNVKVFNGSTAFTNDTALTVKLNVPKLVKQPQNLANAIQDFNNQNVFGGNTFNLDVNNNKLTVAQNGFTDAIKTASADGARFDDLDALLIYEYQIMNSGSGWKSAAELKAFLETKVNIDLSSNQLKMKVSLRPPATGQNAQYELDPNATWEFELLSENNAIVKKYLHGQAIEADLAANKISVTGSKNNLQYTFNDALKVFENNGKDATRELILQYRLLDAQNNPIGNQNWSSGALPIKVAANVQKIEVRVVHDATVTANQAVFVYGPETKGNQNRATIDLSKIATVVVINKTLLETVAIVSATTDSQSINEDLIQKWEEKIWNQIPEAADPQVRSKMTIKYKFASHENLSASNLFSTINNELGRFNDNNHHGIVKLYDKTAPNANAQPNGFKIIATIEKVTANDSTINFVNQQGINIDGADQAEQRSGEVDTSKITTTLDLSDWIQNLIDQKTVVVTQTVGQIQSLQPPTSKGPDTRALFANQAFNEIEKWLKAANINLWWTNQPNNANSWQTIDQIKTYDATQAKLWFAINNDSSNLVLNLGNNFNSLQPGNNNRTQAITINLDAPKLITINPQVDTQGFGDYFNGNTKYLTVQTSEIEKRINQILAKLGPQFNNAPLTLMVRVGNEVFVDYKELSTILKGKTTDVANGSVTVKFAIDQTQPGADKFSLNQGGDAEVALIADQSKIKVFINDQGIFEQLSTQTKLEGNDNTNFRIIWPKGWTLGANGILNAGNIGRGLRLEFSFQDLPQDQPAGTNVNNQWVTNPPNSYTPEKKNLYVRLQTQPNYVYEKIESNNSNTQITPPNQTYKFALPLNLPLSIVVDQAWLNRPFANRLIQLGSIQPTDFDFYENAVKQQISYPQEIKDKIEIRYIFNGEENNKLNRNQLIAKLNEYQQANDDVNKNFGLLQLWNGRAGIKISTTFVKANDADPSYSLTWKNNQNSPVLIITDKIISTIDLISVVNWLENTKVSFTKGNAEGEIVPNSLVFDNVNAQGSPLNNKTWSQVEAALEALNIQVEYLPVFANSPSGANDQDWQPTIAAITKHDTRGQFKVRFRLEGNKGKNILVKIKNTENLVGTTTDAKSNPITVNLKVVRKIIVQQQTLDQFFINKAGSISGNTKFLKINLADEQALIDQIIADNNALFPNSQPPLFTSTVLKVRYALGPTTNQTTWKTAAALQQDLQNQQDDQISNLIKFKFIIETPAGQDVAYSVEETPYDFNSNDTQGQKIKFFVHTKQWENQAAQLIVEGDKQALEWKFAEAFGSTQFIEKPLDPARPQEKQQVYLKTAAGDLLQIHFSTNGALKYEETTVSDNLNDLATKWVKIKPTQIGATDKLFIRIVSAHAGIVYEAAGDPANNVNKTAVVHEVQLRVSTTLTVDKNWFNQIPLSPNEIEIKQFSVNVLNQWINQLKEQIKQANQLPSGATTNELLNKINVQFSLNDQGTYNVNQVVQEINKRLNNFKATDFGIFHLWNPQLNKGLQIKATFVSTDNQVKLKEINGANLFDVLDTSKIYTLINLSQYIQRLKTEKTSVTPKGTAGARPEEISAFNPPGMPGAIGDAFLSGRNYEEIANRLEQVGIKIFFAQEPNATGSDWKPKDQINAYNPRRNKLYLSFTNIAKNNIKLKIDNQTINADANSQNIEIGLPLAVPRQINIDPAQDLQNFMQLINFGGNTKKITYDANGATTIINKILQRNAAEAGNDQAYLTAPLHLKFQIGNTAEFKALTNDELKKFLDTYPNDLTSREIRWKFDLDGANANDWIFDLETQNRLEGILVPDGNSSPIKIYINDKQLFADLSDPDLAGSTSANLKLNWTAKKITVDPNTGVIDAREVVNNNIRGFGLRVEFTYRKDLTGSEGEPTNIDPLQGWSTKIPTSFDQNQTTELYMRIRLTDTDKYVYDRINEKITIDLSQIPTVINLDGDWLQQILTNQPIDLIDLDETKLLAYENLVWAQANLGQADRPKVQIAYTFAGTEYKTKTTLLAALKNYATANNSAPGLGILQLWNNTSGEQISTKFIKADENDQSYIFNIINDNNHVLDTSKILTTIDLKLVLQWLQNIKVQVEEKPNIANSIKNLIFGDVDAPGDPYFHKKTWEQVKTALNSFGIKLQFRSLTKANETQPETGWVDNQSGLNSYDPAFGKIQIRFKFENAKASNIKIKLSDNSTVAGTQTTPTQAFDVKLKIRLVFQVDPQLISQFITTRNVIRGNTKFLEIDEAAEKTLIQNIINANALNNPEFARANLSIGYQLGDGKAGVPWKNRSTFLADLAGNDVDQETNKVVFRFVIDPAQDAEFAITDNTNILHNKETPAAGIRIPYYINTGQWEANAAKLRVVGTSSNLIWNFADAFGAATVVENNGNVYLNNVLGRAIQVFFTTNAQADYDNPAGFGSGPAEIAQKWISAKPTNINAATTTLKVKLVALNSGFVYGPAAETPKIARAHDVDINIQREIIVDKNWFTEKPLVSAPVEINALINNAQLLQEWETAIYNKIQTRNQIDLATAQKIQIKFIYDNGNDRFLKDQLLNHLKILQADFQDPKLGIVQLWNGNRGDQIQAVFVSSDNQYIIKQDGLNQAPTENDLKALVDTNNIYTSISLIDYINHLKTAKTDVDVDPGAQAGIIKGFTPPSMPGSLGQAFLTGHTYEQIAQRLNAVGIEIKFSTKDNSQADADWLNKDQIKSYDIQKSALFLSLENKSSNIKVQIETGKTLEYNQTLRDQPIRLPLNVAKYIIIDPTAQFWATIKDDFNFRENTKFIKFDQTKIEEFVKKILNQNYINSGNDSDYQNAPLQIEFQVGNQVFTEISKLKTYLENLDDDLTSRTINFKFSIPDAEAKNWKLENPDKTYSLLVENDPQIKKLKIYINDKAIFQDLEATKLSGSNTNLIWGWQKGLSVEAAEGTLSAQPLRGQGLRIEFTFNSALTGAATETTGANNETDWVKTIPTKFKPQFNAVYLRIQLVDETKYTYDRLNEKITLDLSQIEKDLELETAWLNQLLISANITNLKLEQLEEQHFTEYEKLVKAAAQANGIDAGLIDKFDINYDFNGQSLTKKELINAIKNFRVANANQASLGILQLWNNAAGQKIIAKFVDANTSDQYIIKVDGQSVQNQPGQILETTKIQTEIDFSKVLNWLQTIKIQIEKGNQTNSITAIKIPNVNSGSQDLYFNGKTWKQVEQALKEFGLIIEYRALKASNENQAEADWVENLNQINSYDPNYGKLQIRFKLDGTKSKNILFKLEANAAAISGANAVKTKAFDLLLDVPLKLVIPPNLLQAFLTQKHISGNTKFLEIDEQKEINFINEIIEFNKTNNSVFADAANRLKIQYTLGNGQNNPQWFERLPFINNLQNKQDDLTSNQISLQFIVKNNDQNNTETKFDVEPTITEVVAHRIAKDAQVKIYAHEKGLEAAAEKLKIVGTNNNFTYTYPNELKPNATSDITGRVGLKLQYSTKLNIQNALYDSTTINQDPSIGWTNVPPTTISAKDRYLVVQVVAVDGYVYGAEYAKTNPNKDPNTPAWKTHQVNVDEIKSQIKLNQSSLEQISFTSRLNNINVNQIKQLEEQAKKAAQLEIPDLVDKLKVEYQIQWTNKWTNSNWISIETLKTEIENYIQDYQNATLGLLKFNVNSATEFATIKARFVSNDQQFVVLDKTINDPEQALQAAQQGRNANTDKFVSPIDLQEYVSSLENNFIQLPTGATQNNISGFKPPMLAGQKGDKLFAGYEYDEIAAALLTIGIKIEFYAPTKGALPLANDQWVDIGQIQALNANNDLFMRFRLDETKVSAAQLETWKNSFILSTKTSEDNWIANANDPIIATTPFKLKVDLPITLTTNKAELKTEFENEFKGNTFQINDAAKATIKNKITQLINKTLNNNSTPGTDVTQAPLKIHFSLDGQVLKTEANGKQLIWFEFDEFVKALATNKTNWNTNQIQARWFIDPEEAVNGQKYLITDGDAIVVQAKNETRAAPLKMYIHKQDAYSAEEAIKKALLVTGSTENYQIANLDNWITTTLPNGLQSQFSNKNPQNNPNDWISYQLNQANLPKPLNANKELWFRYEVKAGYEYQNALTTDVEHSQPILLDTSQLKTIIKLQKDWLKLIVMDGNTKIATFNEDPAHAAINAAGVLPSDKNDLVQFQYAIDNNNWLSQAEFIDLLKTKDGAKDETNFILKRSEIQVRFNLNPVDNVNDAYQMQIDGDLIEVDNRNQHNVQLINDQAKPPLNPAVRGYIEVSHLKDFVSTNFAIEGSNTQPRLKIKQKTALETMMQNYATDQLFDILITGQQKNNGDWDFSKNISLLKAGNKFIDDAELIDRGFVIGANKKVALKFVALDGNYDVYFKGAQQAQGYLLDISENVKVTFEIENPFVKQNKTLALWWTENQDKTQGKYFQGQGGFKIVNGLANGQVDEADFQSALSWLQSVNSGLADKEKEVLEFVYHIYDDKPTETQIQEVGSHNSITNYDDTSTWKKLEPILDTTNNNNEHFTQSLGLKVGQYVSVALRVKEEYATGDDIYTLKDDQHSFMSPITTSSEPGRAHGYKIQTSAVEIEEKQIILENMLNSDQLPLDGYTNIKRLNLKKDEAENYKGVNLELQLFHSFHQGNGKQEVIITPFDKIKLVKRQQGNEIPTEFFKDATGNQIQDDQGNPIPILIDAQGKPKPPEEQNNATITEEFTNYGDGFFGLTAPASGVARDKWGIFKNEIVKVVFKPYQGQGGAAEPDFILDNKKEVNLQDQISPLIKFPIFNQDNIKYEFNHEDFTKDQIQFENATKPENGPIDGRSKVKTLIKLTKTTNIKPEGEIISGDDVSQTVTNLKNELQSSFKNKLRFETLYEKSDGGSEIRPDLDLYKFTTLKNNDRIKVKIVSADNDFIWAEPPKQLTIHVTGLTAKAPERNKLRFLRVEQSGTINGEGAFKVLINDPKDPNSNAKDLLEGWKFVLRVWNEEQQIKTNWTDDQNQITNLKNGDKIEWKLLDEFGNPVSDPYYNTVAGDHKFNPDGSTEFVFNQMHYPDGKNSAQIATQGIGQYPSDPNIYPERSGFVISGLKDALEVFEIGDAAFAKVMAQLEPHYVGLNGQGTINFKEDYLSKNYYVNSLGDLYEKPFDQPTFKQQVDDGVVEISLADFLANTTFYTSDPNLINYQNGFKFLGNDTNLNNHLSNGDQVWAQFDLRADNNEVNRGISTELNPVTGLKDVVTDPMTPLWYILMAIAGIVSFGGLSLLMIWAKRNRKFKK